MGDVFWWLMQALLIFLLITMALDYRNTSNEYIAFKRSLRTCLLDGNVTAFQTNSTDISIDCTSYTLTAIKHGQHWLIEAVSPQ